MDAHSVSFTSVADRSTSRIWKDLSAYQHLVAVQLLEEDMSAAVDMMGIIGKVHLTDCKLEGFNLWERVAGTGLRLKWGPILPSPPRSRCSDEFSSCFAASDSHLR